MCDGVRAAWRCCLSACLERLWKWTETGAVSSGADTECGLVGYVTWSSRWLLWLPQLLRSVLTPSCSLFFLCRRGRVLHEWNVWWLIDWLIILMQALCGPQELLPRLTCIWHPNVQQWPTADWMCTVLCRWAVMLFYGYFMYHTAWIFRLIGTSETVTNFGILC